MSIFRTIELTTIWSIQNSKRKYKPKMIVNTEPTTIIKIEDKVMTEQSVLRMKYFGYLGLVFFFKSVLRFL